MQYVMVVEVPEEMLDGDDSIEVAARIVNDDLRLGSMQNRWNQPGATVRPLSEVIAC